MQTRRLAASIVAVLLAACGGGGGGGGGADSPTNANLASLAVSAGTLAPAFSPDVTAYHLHVGLDAGSVSVTPVTAAAAATVTVDGATTPSGSASDPVTVELGPTPIAVVVTAADGTTTRTYSLVVDRSGPLVQEAYVKPLVVGALDRFGSVVAVSGDTLVVGAPREASAATGVDGDPNDDSTTLSGAAYVFVRTGATWTQQAYLKASNTDASDGFGAAVAVSGDTIVVGAPGEESSATGVNGNQGLDDVFRAGAAYVFVRTGTTWTQQAYLKAPDVDPADDFGTSVAVSGNTVVVGAPGENGATSGIGGDPAIEGFDRSGAAVVFVRSGATWTQQAYVKASNTGTVDLFGTSVAISGDTMVVGAEGEDSGSTGVNGVETDEGTESAGAAYVFVRSGTVWTQQAYLKASNTDASDLFGHAVAIDGDTVVVGANLEDSSSRRIDVGGADDGATDSGAAYVFARTDKSWAQQAFLKPSNTGALDEFGAAVAVSGDLVVVGAPFDDSVATGIGGNALDDSLQDPGAVFAFARTGVVWEQASFLKPSVTDPADVIGLSVSVSGDTIAFGAFGEDGSGPGVNADPNDDGQHTSGAAYILR